MIYLDITRLIWLIHLAPSFPASAALSTLRIKSPLLTSLLRPRYGGTFIRPLPSTHSLHLFSVLPVTVADVKSYSTNRLAEIASVILCTCLPIVPRFATIVSDRYHRSGSTPSPPTPRARVRKSQIGKPDPSAHHGSRYWPRSPYERLGGGRRDDVKKDGKGLKRDDVRKDKSQGPTRNDGDATRNGATSDPSPEMLADRKMATWRQFNTVEEKPTAAAAAAVAVDDLERATWRPLKAGKRTVDVEMASWRQLCARSHVASVAMAGAVGVGGRGGGEGVGWEGGGG